MKFKILFVFFMTVSAAPLFAEGIQSYFHVSPLSLDRGFPSFTSMDFMELGFGIGPVIIGTELLGYKEMPGSYISNIEIAPIRTYFMLSNTPKTKLYGFFTYSYYGETEIQETNYYIFPGVRSFSLGVGATFHNSLRLRIGYYNGSSNDPQTSLRSNTLYASLGSGFPDFYGKWRKVKNKNNAFKRVLLTTLAGTLGGSIIGTGGFLAFSEMNDSRNILSGDPYAFAIVFFGAPAGLLVGLISGIYWTTSCD